MARFRFDPPMPPADVLPDGPGPNTHLWGGPVDGQTVDADGNPAPGWVQFRVDQSWFGRDVAAARQLWVDPQDGTGIVHLPHVASWPYTPSDAELAAAVPARFRGGERAGASGGV